MPNDDGALFAVLCPFGCIGGVFVISAIFSWILSCPDGTFDNSWGLGGCETCPAREWRAPGAWSFGMSDDSECMDCKSDGVDADHTMCNPCPPGKWANYGCDDCPSGRYQESESLDECLECAEGTMSSKDRTSCIPCFDYDSSCARCPEGKDPTGDRTACVCPAGQQPVYILLVEQDTCESCPDNKVRGVDEEICHECPPGRVPNERLDECMECGHHEISDSLRCTQCPAGLFPNRHHSECVACHEGAVLGSHGCHECHHPTVPNPDRTECVTCHPPQFAKTDGCANCTGSKLIQDYECVACPLGAVPNHDHTECHQCAGRQVPTDDGTRCQVCPEDKIPKADRSGCRACNENEVPNADNGECEECTGASVPHLADSGRLHCKNCVLPKFQFLHKECKRCDDGKIPTQDQSDCTECGELEMVSQNGIECECMDGYFRSGDSSCEKCSGDEVSDRHKTRCVSCPHGTEPSFDHSHCMSFGRTQFLLAQWPSFVPAVLIFLTVVIILYFLIKWKKPAGYVVVGNESFEANKFGKSKFWKACLCGKEPQNFPWWVLGLWDLIDYALYVVWFLNGKPANGSNAEFAHDYVVAWGCSVLIWFGGVLPSLMWVLPRQAYVLVEIIYDFLEFATVWWVTETYSFKADVSGGSHWSTTILVVLNYSATLIDTLMIKGPEFLDTTFSFFGCCVNLRLKESRLTKDVTADEHQVFLKIEAYLVFQKGDTVLINDDEHIVSNLLTDSIFIKPPTRNNHSVGAVVRLKIRNGEEIQHDEEEEEDEEEEDEEEEDEEEEEEGCCASLFKRRAPPEEAPATSGSPNYALMVSSPSSPRAGDPEMPPLPSPPSIPSADPGTRTSRVIHRQSW